jgi:hypothetical protein
MGAGEDALDDSGVPFSFLSTPETNEVLGEIDCTSTNQD